MRAQIIMMPNLDGKNPVTAASGMMDGLIINCDTDEKLMKTLEVIAMYGNKAEVKMLKDDEPWPARRYDEEEGDSV